MAYQQPTQCRFYCNALEWLNTIGYKTSFPGDDNVLHEVYKTLPVRQVEYGGDIWDLPKPTGHNENRITGLTTKSFVATLGHLSGQREHKLYILIKDPPGNYYEVENYGAGFNTTPWSGYKDGFTIQPFEATIFHDSIIQVASYYYNQETNLWEYTVVGSVVIGTYYDMPNNANQSLTMSRESGHTNTITTHNGSSMSNTMNNRPSKWGDLGAWEINVPPNTSNPVKYPKAKLAYRSGRRSWNLTFSYIDKKDLYMPNPQVGWYDAGGYYPPIYGYDTSEGLVQSDIKDIGVDNVAYNSNITSDDSFYSQVWQKTLGGTLPFLFQPDKDDFTNMAICRFTSPLKTTQSAHGVYDISLSIEEIW